MPEKKADSFRDKNLKEKILIVIGIILLIIFVVGFVFAIYFFGLAGAFTLLGVQYESIWSLVVFVTIFIMLGIIVELFAKVIFYLFVRNITGNVKLFFARLIFEGTLNWLLLFTIDEMMRSIVIPLQTEIIIALVIALLEIVFDDKKK